MTKPDIEAGAIEQDDLEQQQAGSQPSGDDPEQEGAEGQEGSEGEGKKKRRVIQTTVAKAFGHLKQKYPHADPRAMVEKMERDLRSYPQFVQQNRKQRIFVHVEVTTDTIEWLRDVADVLCE